jgi:hypothetical protein
VPRRQRQPFIDPERIWIWLLAVAAVILVSYLGLRFAGDLGLDKLFGK